MKRREFVAGMVAVPVAGFVRPEALPVRRATFEEIGSAVLLTLALPTLFRRGDKEALVSIDSGFDTTLLFELRLWRYGVREKIVDVEHTVKLRWDPWKRRYVVRAQTSTGWNKREFELRDDALAAATTLKRVRLTSSSALQRAEDGTGPYYFVEVLALRNPLLGPKGRLAERPSDRGGGRDLEWFSRLVDVVAGERAVAEETLHLRTNPFYLPPR